MPPRLRGRESHGASLDQGGDRLLAGGLDRRGSSTGQDTIHGSAECGGASASFGGALPALPDSIAANELELAKRDLDRAIILDANSLNLQSTRRDIELYRAALEAYLEQDWPKAVSLLNDVYERTPDFRDTRSMLGQAHCYLAEQQLNNDSLDEALAQATLCEEILEGDEEASALVKRVMETIRPARRIEVTLSDFRVRIYEDNEVIKSFPICYGRPSHPTKTGRFEIQSKVENAYASTWDMDMPYWLGIYWAGAPRTVFTPCRS